MAQHDKEGVTRKSAIVYAAVFSIIVSILSFLVVGWLLDRWLGTGPWLIVTSIVLGSAVGFFEFIRLISRASE